MLHPEFFTPSEDPAQGLNKPLQGSLIGHQVKAYTLGNTFPDPTPGSVAIIGVSEYRRSDFGGLNGSGLSQFRNKFYRLQGHEHAIPIFDLGDLKPGNSAEDTLYALKEILEDLLSNDVLPILIGGSQDLTTAMYESYKRSKKLVSIASVDSRFDLGSPGQPCSSTAWLGEVIMQQPTYLFNFSNIGHQTYFVGSDAVDFMSKLYFDTYRLGQVRSELQEIEPVIRACDLLSFDLSSIRQADAPGTTHPSPNGFSGEEACQMMLYAGLNDQLTSVGVFELDITSDRNDQTAHLLAQMIWYLMEGISCRKGDFPEMSPASNFTTFHVGLGKNDSELLFVKHNYTGRWWLELPPPVRDDNPDLIRKKYLSCSYKDYQQACQNEMPDRLWQILQKL